MKMPVKAKDLPGGLNRVQLLDASGNQLGILAAFEPYNVQRIVERCNAPNELKQILALLERPGTPSQLVEYNTQAAERLRRFLVKIA